ncbi:hypothetical protein [Paraburkholderia graminis]|uniref:hypothetical protein n=1 Tax=Paraburkholderia graminis TaxID=60548 RepID=UPI0038B75CCC
MDRSFRIHLLGKTSAEGNELTGDLKQELERRVSNLRLLREKGNPESQDAGTILVAVLAAPAMVELVKGPLNELAKGLADWMRRRNVSSLTFDKEGGVRVENVGSDAILVALKKVLEENSPDRVNK